MLFGQVTRPLRAPRVHVAGDRGRRPATPVEHGRSASARTRRAPAAAAARPDHPGRAAPDQRPARHAGRPVRDGDRQALHLGGGRQDGPPQGDRLDRDDPQRRRAGADACSCATVSVFPPPGLDVRDNFFSVQRQPSAERVPGRRYLGICAPGRRLKAAVIRVYVALLCCGPGPLREARARRPTRG